MIFCISLHYCSIFFTIVKKNVKKRKDYTKMSLIKPYKTHAIIKII